MYNSHLKLQLHIMVRPKHSKNKSRAHKGNNRKSTTLRGGRNSIVSPKIKYIKGSATEHTLACTKCGKGTFIIKTLTMGTKLKSLIGVPILDNRFKVFTCITCGFVQLYSNNITCSGKQCDPLYSS